jgi:hypothetical protein
MKTDKPFFRLIIPLLCIAVGFSVVALMPVPPSLTEVPAAPLIPDAPLRSAIAELQQRTLLYDEFPATPEEAEAGVIKLWASSDQVATFFERFHRRSGEKSAREAKVLIEPIYESMFSKLRSIENDNPKNEFLVALVRSMRADFESLKR